MPDDTKLKRPASHRWVIGVFGFMTAGFVIFLLDVTAGRSGASLRQWWLPVVFLSVGALAFLSVLVGRREKWAYYVTSASLAIWAVRAAYTSSQYIYYLVRHQSAGPIPYFHLAERHKVFVEPQHMSVTRQMLVPAGTVLLLWLLFQFARGRASRAYYMFDEGGKNGMG